MEFIEFIQTTELSQNDQNLIKGVYLGWVRQEESAVPNSGKGLKTAIDRIHGIKINPEIVAQAALELKILKKAEWYAKVNISNFDDHSLGGILTYAYGDGYKAALEDVEDQESQRVLTDKEIRDKAGKIYDDWGDAPGLTVETALIIMGEWCREQLKSK